MLDVIIIYLACGSPLGVHLFLQNRQTSSKRFWLKSLLNFVFWPAVAFRVLQNNSVFRKKPSSVNSKTEEKISELQEKMEEPFAEDNNAHYHFREIFERYVGLTLALKFEKPDNSERAKEFYRIAGHNNVEIAVTCLSRRNRERLSFHQTLARNDFLEVVSTRQNNRFGSSAIELAEALGDFEALEYLHVMFRGGRQIDEETIVNDVEKEVWKSEAHNPFPADQKQMNLPTMTATAGGHKKG